MHTALFKTTTIDPVTPKMSRSPFGWENDQNSAFAMSMQKSLQSFEYRVAQHIVLALKGHHMI